MDAEGMPVEIRPLPRGTSRGDAGGRSTGILADRIQEVAPWQGMRSAVTRKAKRYGQPNLPLVVALGAMEQYADLDHVMDALYGTEGAAVSSTGDWRRIRQPDGVWSGPNGPQYRRLSAVLVAHQLQPWSLGHRLALFVENAWATRPADFIDFQVAALRPHGDVLRQIEGRTVQNVFGVPKGWPEVPGVALDPY